MKQGGLKKLYKSYKIDQREFEKLFHENIFKDLKHKFSEYLVNSFYLNWESIKKYTKKISLLAMEIIITISFF